MLIKEPSKDEIVPLLVAQIVLVKVAKELAKDAEVVVQVVQVT